MNQEGFLVDRTSKKIGDEFVNGMWVSCLKFVNVVKVMNDFPLSLSRTGKELELDSYRSQRSQEKEVLLINWQTVQDILLDRPANEIDLVTLISYGVLEKDIQKWKNDGKIFESRNGFIKLL